MFQSKTVFVVGAGASKEVGLPTGKELRETIARKLEFRNDSLGKLERGDREILLALDDHLSQIRREHRPENRDAAPSLQDLVNAGHHIAKAMPQALSIDNYIDMHQDDKIEVCGKLAIVQSILEAEARSTLHFDSGKAGAGPDYRALEETWFNSFMQILTEDHRRDGIDRLFENVSFITFNYDRCIEHYLFHALQNYYVISGSEAAELLGSLDILHPYGQVGDLPWQPDGRVPFGMECGALDLLAISQRVKTFTERVDDPDVLKKMRDLVYEAEVVVFLGFGFHPQNMELIKPPKGSSAARVFATGRGISDSDCPVVEHQIKVHFGKWQREFEVHLGKKLTCSELFGEYWRSLAYS